MNLLTDDEILSLRKWDGKGSTLRLDKLAFARAIEAAILAKLASAELPEPQQYPAECFMRELPVCDALAVSIAIKQAYVQGAAAQLAKEPTAFMYQHDETGRVGFLEAWGPIDHFKASNPRLRIVASLYTRREA
jgi:hypothetical protein